MITYYVFAGLAGLAIIGFVVFWITEVRESRYWNRQETFNEENL